MRATQLLLLVLASATGHLMAEEPAYLDPAVGIKFPVQIANFQFQKAWPEIHSPTIVYEPGDGHQIRYTAPGVNLDILVIVKEKSADPEDGVQDEEVEAGWVHKRSYMLVDEARRRADTEDLREVGKVEIVFRGQPVPFLLRKGTLFWVEARGAKERTPGLFAIYVTGFRGHYIVLRAFYLERDREAGEKSVAAAAASMAKLIKDAKDSPLPKVEPAK